MTWLGWIVAVVAIGFAVWLARQLSAERALTTQLRFAKIEAENATDALRSNQAQAIGAAGLAPLGKLLGATANELDAPLASVRSQVDHAARQLADYRELVKRYDASVQYCLQPVELIFGADKASLDKLVLHVEGARRALFEARGNLEKSSALDESRHLLETAAESLRDIGALTQSLSQFAATAPADTQPVDVNLMLPSGWFGTFTSGADIALEMAMYRAYHQWMEDYCKPFPERLGGVILCCARDVQGSLAEIAKWGIRARAKFDF